VHIIITIQQPPQTTLQVILGGIGSLLKFIPL
jgi:hypothetical protein